MFDISRQNIAFACPKCRQKNSVSLAQVANQATISCSGCRQRINLKDKNNSVDRSISSINNAMRDFENTIKKLGR